MSLQPDDNGMSDVDSNVFSQSLNKSCQDNKQVITRDPEKARKWIKGIGYKTVTKPDHNPKVVATDSNYCQVNIELLRKQISVPINDITQKLSLLTRSVIRL